MVLFLWNALLSFYLSSSLPFYFSLSLCLSPLSLFLYLYLFHSTVLFLSISLSLFLYLYLFHSLSFYLSPPDEQVRKMCEEGNRCKQRNIILGNGKRKPKVVAQYDYVEKSNREVKYNYLLVKNNWPIYLLGVSVHFYISLSVSLDLSRFPPLFPGYLYY